MPVSDRDRMIPLRRPAPPVSARPPGRAGAAAPAWLRWLAVASFMLVSGAACARQGVQSVDAKQVFSDPRVAELAQAAARGESGAVRDLAAAGVPLDSRGDKQATLLQWALLNKSLSGMEALLAAGADPAQPGIDGDTVVHLAAMADDPRYLALLLRHGADPDARNPETGTTPLFSALRGKRGTQFEALLAAGADPDAADRGGNTPLHQAGKYNDPGHALKLLEAGADPRRRNVQDVTFQRFLFKPNEAALSGQARRDREAVRAWLRAHDVAVEDGG